MTLEMKEGSPKTNHSDWRHTQIFSAPLIYCRILRYCRILYDIVGYCRILCHIKDAFVVVFKYNKLLIVKCFSSAHCVNSSFVPIPPSCTNSTFQYKVLLQYQRTIIHDLNLHSNVHFGEFGRKVTLITSAINCGVVRCWSKHWWPW